MALRSIPKITRPIPTTIATIAKATATSPQKTDGMIGSTNEITNPAITERYPQSRQRAWDSGRRARIRPNGGAAAVVGVLAGELAGLLPWGGLLGAPIAT